MLDRAGLQVAKWNNRLPADAERLVRLMDDHRLTHLTSWSRRAGPTYICGPHRSVIDHVFTRTSQATSVARLAGRDSFRLAAWRSGGYHVALSGVLPLAKFTTLNAGRQKSTRTWDQDSLVRLCQDPTSAPSLAVRHQVATLLPACCNIEDLNLSLTQVLQTHLPATTRPSRLAPWQTAAMRAGIRVMWQHYRSWRQTASGTGRTIWQAWMHYAKFKRAHKDFRSAGRQARSEWYQDRLGDLQAHARRKDARSLYQGVRRLAPKSKQVAVQLRSSAGQLLSPQQQVSLLRTHYEGVYANTLPDPPRDPDMPPLQLTEVDLFAAIRALKTHKAVPAHLAPIAAWKL